MESSFLFRLNQDEIQGCFLFPQEFFQIQFQGLLTSLFHLLRKLFLLENKFFIFKNWLKKFAGNYFSGKAKSKNAQRGKTGAAKNFAGRFELNTEIIFFEFLQETKAHLFQEQKQTFYQCSVN